jgi:hypothetical protein
MFYVSVDASSKEIQNRRCDQLSLDKLENYEIRARDILV